MTISDVFPVLDSMSVHLQPKDDNSALTNEIRKRLLDSLCNRYKFNLTDVDDYCTLSRVTQIMLITTFLDPRYKDNYIRLELITDLLLTETINLGNLEQREPVEVGDQPAKKPKTALQAFIVNKGPSSSADGCLTLRDRLKHEIGAYLATSSVPHQLPTFVLEF